MLLCVYFFMSKSFDEQFGFFTKSGAEKSQNIVLKLSSDRSNPKIPNFELAELDKTKF